MTPARNRIYVTDMISKKYAGTRNGSPFAEADTAKRRHKDGSAHIG
jgi:hypothetical protein